MGLFGLPNAGKATVFNGLTGSRFRTVNYPGTTLEYEPGRMTLEQNGEVRVLDLPGVSNFTGNSSDEDLTLDILFGESVHGRTDVYLAILEPPRSTAIFRLSSGWWTPATLSSSFSPWSTCSRSARNYLSAWITVQGLRLVGVS